eukprot:COSAG02_NODE_6392_length_3602_cov_38.216386_1_plen_71_part_10
MKRGRSDSLVFVDDAVTIEGTRAEKGQPMTVAEIIAAETAAIQKRWKEQKVTENPLSLNVIGSSSIFPSVL